MICECGMDLNFGNTPSQIKCRCGRIKNNFSYEKVTKEEKEFDYYKQLMKHNRSSEIRATNKCYKT